MPDFSYTVKDTLMDTDATIISFPQGRYAKTRTANPEDVVTEIKAAVKRHPAGNALTGSTDDDHVYLGTKEILPAGIQTINLEEINYRVKRLDAVLAHMGAQNSPADMKRLVKHIKEAMYTTAELTYFEGLAEGYTSYEEEEDD